MNKHPKSDVVETCYIISFSLFFTYNVSAVALIANPIRNNLNDEDTINEITEFSCVFPNPGEKPGIRDMIILVS